MRGVVCRLGRVGINLWDKIHAPIGHQRRVSTLVTTHWLRDHLGVVSQYSGAGTRLLDTSWVPKKSVDGYREFYQQGHISGAAYFDHGKCVNGTPLIPRNIPELPCFTDYIQSLGVGTDTHVVVYDRLNTRAAARAWWIFRLFGHENVSVLDGGMIQWVEDGFAVTVEEPEYEKSDFQGKLNKSLLRDFEDMQRNLDTNQDLVMDARDPEEFTGEVKTGTRPGHIPGAVNVPFYSVFKEDGRFKSKDELMRLFESCGVDLGRPLVSMCLTGLTACALVTAAHIVGKDDVAVYNGSWKEWSDRVSEDLCVTAKS